MQLFYSTDISDQNIILSNEDAKHCIKSLRKEIGDEVRVVDGKGNLYITTLHDYGKSDCKLTINETIKDYSKRENYVHIIIAPTKNISRTEWFVEKAVEIGVDEISFADCTNSERHILKINRIERIAISAMKQSMKSFLPKINPIENFEKIIANCSQENKYIGYLGEKGTNLSSMKFNDSCMFIGPEGDFTDKEIELAKVHDFKIVSLGNSRLRTETAGVVSCMILNDSK